MHYLILDTCVLLDISTRKNDLPIVVALESLVSSGTIQLVVPILIADEYNRNKDSVADKTRMRLSSEFIQVKNIVKEFGGDDKKM